MKKLKQDLKTVTSELKKIVKKTESLAARVEKMEKAQATKAKPAKKPAVKKPSVKSKSTKGKSTAKRTSQKKTAK